MLTPRALSGLAVCAALITIAANADCEIDFKRFHVSLSAAALAARNNYFEEQCTRANGNLIDATDPSLKTRLVRPSKLVAPKGEYYPVWAKRHRIEGTTRLVFVIETDGSIRDVTVIESSGNKLLDDSAVSLYRNSRYEAPAMLDGRLVRVLDYGTLSFSLRRD